MQIGATYQIGDCGSVWRPKSANCQDGREPAVPDEVSDHEGAVVGVDELIQPSPEGSWRVRRHCLRDLSGWCR